MSHTLYRNNMSVLICNNSCIFPPVYALITLLSPTASIEAESCASFKVSSIYRNSSLLNILTADSNTSSSNEYLKKKAVHFILSSFALFWSLHLPFSVQIQDISFSPLPSHMQVLILSLSPEVSFSSCHYHQDFCPFPSLYH